MMPDTMVTYKGYNTGHIVGNRYWSMRRSDEGCPIGPRGTTVRARRIRQSLETSLYYIIICTGTSCASVTVKTGHPALFTLQDGWKRSLVWAWELCPWVLKPISPTAMRCHWLPIPTTSRKGWERGQLCGRYSPSSTHGRQQALLM